MNQRNLYLYEGPVMQFGKVILDSWRAGTKAVSDKQALAFLSFQFKNKKKMSIHNTKIELDKRYLRIEERGLN